MTIMPNYNRISHAEYKPDEQNIATNRTPVIHERKQLIDEAFHAAIQSFPDYTKARYTDSTPMMDIFRIEDDEILCMADFSTQYLEEELASRGLVPKYANALDDMMVTLCNARIGYVLNKIYALFNCDS